MTNKDKSNEVYEYIRDYILKNMYSPTIREIMAGVGFKSTSSVHYNILKLEKEGKITLSDNNNKIALVGYKIVEQ